MGARGRKSVGELAVSTLANIQTIERPDAPYDLTDEQAEEWRAVVDRMPADWFPRETWGLLAQYCRHVIAARKVAQLIGKTEKSKDFNILEYDLLLKMQEREGRAMSSLATRMRLTQHSTYDKTKKKPAPHGKNPWE